MQLPYFWPSTEKLTWRRIGRIRDEIDIKLKKKKNRIKYRGLWQENQCGDNPRFGSWNPVYVTICLMAPWDEVLVHVFGALKWPPGLLERFLLSNEFWSSISESYRTKTGQNWGFFSSEKKKKSTAYNIEQGF